MKMPLMQSCCCWRSLRRGAYASAAYTLGYFTLIVIVVFNFLHEEKSYWSNGRPRSTSILEQEISLTTMLFNVVMLVCALFGVVTSVLLAYGVYKDRKELLIPWIIAVITSTLIDIAHGFYIFSLQNMKFHPETAFLYTLDFFLLVLNLYCLVCVISQYQEYKVGRGTAEHDNVVLRSKTLSLPAVIFKNKKNTIITNNIQRDQRFVEKKSIIAIDECSKIHNNVSVAIDSTKTAIPPPSIQSRPVNNHNKGSSATATKKHVQFGAEVLIPVYSKLSKSERTEKGFDMESSTWKVLNDEKPNNLDVDEEPLIIDSK